MHEQIRSVRIGLLLVILTLIFGIGLGITFGVAEDSVKAFITEGVNAHPNLHDGNSISKIWRYAQRAHFHATGIAAFSIGLVVLIMFSSLKRKLKKIAAILVGLGGLYPCSWLSLFILAPSMGRSAAHQHIITEMLAYIGTGSLLAGLAILCANLFFDFFAEI